MKGTLAAIALAFVATLPSACAGDTYGRGIVSWTSYPYHGWYNGFYGPFHDGYWGTDGYFYFRLLAEDRFYRRDRARHFRREAVHGNSAFRRFDRNLTPPPRGTRMPSFPRSRPPHRGN